MERLLEGEESGRSWSLQNDRDLLKALSDLSSDLMSRMHRLESEIEDLETTASSTNARLGNASASFSGLCHSHFIEQEVAPFSTPEESKAISSHVTLTPENFKEVIHPKYSLALRLASQAFAEAEAADRDPVALPLVFGSPEYLQDAKFGIGLSSNAKAQPQPQLEAPQVLEGSSLVGGETQIPDATIEDDERSEEVPDFRSMLEAALRGDFDGGLEQDSRDDTGNGGADSLLQSLDIQETGAEGDAPPVMAHRTDIARDVTRGGADTNTETGESLLLADTERGSDAWPAEVGVSSNDSNSNEYKSPQERSLNLQELLQGNDDLFSEEDLQS